MGRGRKKAEDDDMELGGEDEELDQDEEDLMKALGDEDDEEMMRALDEEMEEEILGLDDGGEEEEEEDDEGVQLGDAEAAEGQAAAASAGAAEGEAAAAGGAGGGAEVDEMDGMDEDDEEEDGDDDEELEDSSEDPDEAFEKYTAAKEGKSKAEEKAASAAKEGKAEEGGASSSAGKEAKTGAAGDADAAGGGGGGGGGAAAEASAGGEGAGAHPTEAAAADAAAAEGGGGEEEEGADDGDDGGDAEPAAAAAPRGKGKPKDLNAPSRPKIPYMRFAQSIRAELMEKDPSLRSDLGAIGKAVAAEWAKVSEEEKTAQQAAYDKEKAEYDVQMAKYKTTASFKKFQAELRDWQDARDLRNLEKKEKAREGGCPKRPAGAYWRFAAKVREELGKGLGLAEIGKAVGERWAALSATEQAAWQKEAGEELAKYQEALAAYRRSPGFHAYAEARCELERKQAVRRLKAKFEDLLPKRPPNPAQLFARQQGARGGLAEVQRLFDALGEEEKNKYKEEAAELRKKFAEEMVKFKESKDGQRFKQGEVAALRRARLRAARMKLLVDAPAKPPTAKALFMASRRQSGEPGGASLTARSVEQLWEKAGAEERKPFEEEAAAKLEDYKKRLEEFHQSSDFKKLQAVEERSKNLGRGKGGKLKAKKGKGRGRGGPSKDTAKGRGRGRGRGGKVMGKAKAKASVPRPASMPAAPQTTFQLFAQRRRAEGRTCSLREFGHAPPEERRQLNEEHQKQREVYEAAMKDWVKTPDGLRYRREEASAAARAAKAAASENLKRKVAKAEAAFFEKDPKPKKPPAAMMLYAASKERPPGKVAERWADLGQEGQAKWEAERRKLVEAYEKRMAEFHCSALYRRATRVSGGRGGSKSLPQKQERSAKELAAPLPPRQSVGSSASAAAAAPAPAPAPAAAEGPQEPRRPKTAYLLFMDEMRAQLAREAPGLPVKELAQKITERWRALGEKGQRKYEDKAAELLKEYEIQLQNFTLSAVSGGLGAAGGPAEAAAGAPARAPRSRVRGAASPRGRGGPPGRGASPAGTGSRGRGRSRGGRGKGGGKKDEGAAGSESEDIMGSDTSSSSSSSS